MKKMPGNLSRQKFGCNVFLTNRLATTTDQARTVVAIFTLCGLLMSTGMGMVTPVFAHLFKESSSGLRSLSFMTMVPHIALLLLAPFIGELEDRYGKRPFLLLGFAGLVVADIGYLFAHSVTTYIAIRLFQAIVSVGIMPAIMGIFADVVSRQQRTHRISLIMAGHAGGLMLGPVAGGFLLSHWGASAPFSISALLNFVVLLLIGTLLPKTTTTLTDQPKVPMCKVRTWKNAKLLMTCLMVPLSFLVGLLVLDFVSAFGQAFIAPQKALYFYKVLNFTPVQFGLLMSAHGLATLVGSLLLSLWGNSVNKRMTIVLGFLSHAFLIFSLLFVHEFTALFLLSLFAGIGGGMMHPLLNAYFLACTTPHHRSSLIGIKEAIGAFGNIAGSLTVVLASSWLIPERTFMFGGYILMGAGLLALVILRSNRVALSSSAMLTTE